MKVVQYFCKVCQENMYLRIVWIGDFWVMATCSKCNRGYRFNEKVTIIESE